MHSHPPEPALACGESSALERTLAAETLLLLDRPVDLQAILSAWQGATARLEQTHEALRSEVRRLTDELEIKNRELARKNRLADLGQIASHVAHEVRNNLVPVSLYLSLLRRRLSDQGSLDVLAKIEAGVLSLDATVNDLLGFAVDREPRLEIVRLSELLEDVLSSVAPQLAAQRIATVVHVPCAWRLTADRDMLRRAVLNVVLNSLDAMPAGGELALSSRHSAATIDLEIADSGPGLSEEARQRAFEPFFTTKSTGTGLGLAIVFRACEAHGGRVSVRNRPRGGAAVTLHLPACPQEAAA